MFWIHETDYDIKENRIVNGDNIGLCLCVIKSG